MRRALAPALAAAAALLLAGCTGGSQEKAPGPFATRDATTMLQDTLIMSGLKARLIGEYPDSVANVGVSVVNGVVTLRGAVRDAKTRDHMVQDAELTPHVRRVVNQLRVDPNARRFQDQVGDVALAARVQAAITAQVGVQHVGVRVERAVATLDGTVPDPKTKRTILATARGTSGIRNVVDRIRVAVP